MGFPKNPNLNWLLKLFAISVAFQVSHAVIELQDIAEICPGNFVTQDFNASWEYARGHIDSDTPLYRPLTSKYSTMVLTQYLHQSYDFKLLTESQLENSCLVVNKLKGWNGFKITGYNSLTQDIEFHSTGAPKVFRFELPMSSGVPISGTASIALTDNENYMVFDFCFDNGLRSFSVLSRDPVLSETSLAVIKAHMKSLGFKERNFIYHNILDCLDVNGKVMPRVDDLPIPDRASTSILHVYQQLISLVPGSQLVQPINFYKKK